MNIRVREKKSVVAVVKLKYIEHINFFCASVSLHFFGVRNHKKKFNVILAELLVDEKMKESNDRVARWWRRRDARKQSKAMNNVHANRFN